jgi:hypothetical protein
MGVLVLHIVLIISSLSTGFYTRSLASKAHCPRKQAEVTMGLRIPRRIIGFNGLSDSELNMYHNDKAAIEMSRGGSSGTK